MIDLYRLRLQGQVMTNEMYKIPVNRSSQFCTWENGTLMHFNIQQSLILFRALFWNCVFLEGGEVLSQC